MPGSLMSSLQARTASRAPISIVNHAARLELLEYYLVHHEDLARCAHATPRVAGPSCRRAAIGLPGRGQRVQHARGHRRLRRAQRGGRTLFLADVGYGGRAGSARSRRRSRCSFKPSRSNGHPGRVLPSTPLGSRALHRDPAARRARGRGGRPRAAAAAAAGRQRRPTSAGRRPCSARRSSRFAAVAAWRRKSGSCGGSARSSSRSSTPSPTRSC